MSDLFLVPLSENPNLGSRPLEWSLELWGQGNPWFSADDWRAFYQRGAVTENKHWNLSGTEQEYIFIALAKGEVVGAIALVDFDDVEEFRAKKPWVAAFVVDPARRGEGIGSLILAALEEKAREFAIAELYLWTEDKHDFYAKRGYQLFAHRDYPEISIDVMHKKL